jgi:D-alanyl-D-alanine carboxypeptidase
VKCINKLTALALAVVLIASVTGCSGLPYSSKYSLKTSEAGEIQNLYYPTYASDLCVVNSDITEADISISSDLSAGLFDLNNKETLYAVNINEQVMPASLTKVMTAYCALKYGSLDQVLVAGSDVYVNESGAQKIGLKEGDRMTLDQALRILLIYSANDVANLIASNISGSVDEFVELMNTEAKNIGATNTHFENPHGLTSENHVVTAYDMYLIFNAALSYDTFSEIINMKEYSTTYLDLSGGVKEVSISSTNNYLSGKNDPPTGVTVIGGKTGTTQAAGHCLILFARDTSGNPYVAIIMKDSDNGALYSDMSKLLSVITK